MKQLPQGDDGNGAGRGMLLAAWIGALALLTLLFGQVLEQRTNPNGEVTGVVTEAGLREVSLQRNSSGHYVATGRINGVPVKFLVDTGATDVALPEPLAERLRLARQTGGFSQTANGVVAVWRTRLDRVQLGSIEQRNVRASILPGDGLNGQVLLGMSFLKQLELFQSGDTLTLRQGNPGQ